MNLGLNFIQSQGLQDIDEAVEIATSDLDILDENIQAGLIPPAEFFQTKDALASGSNFAAEG